MGLHEQLRAAEEAYAALRARRDESRRAMNAALNNLRDARRTDPRAYTAIAEQEARLAWVRADTLKAHDDFNEMAGEVRKLRRDAKAETRVPA